MGHLGLERIEVEDVAVATLKFESGALGVIEATTTAYPGALKRIEISGSEAGIGLKKAKGRFVRRADLDATRSESPVSAQTIQCCA